MLVAKGLLQGQRSANWMCIGGACRRRCGGIECIAGRGIANDLHAHIVFALIALDIPVELMRQMLRVCVRIHGRYVRHRAWSRRSGIARRVGCTQDCRVARRFDTHIALLMRRVIVSTWRGLAHRLRQKGDAEGADTDGAKWERAWCVQAGILASISNEALYQRELGFRNSLAPFRRTTPAMVKPSRTRAASPPIAPSAG